MTHTLLFSIAFILITVSAQTVSADTATGKQNLPTSTLMTTGGPFSFSDYRGKVILIDFWASWCAPCRESFPWMNLMHQRYLDRGLTIIAINLDSEAPEATAFLKRNRADFSVIYDNEGLSAETMNVEAMPTSFLIDRKGILRHTLTGFTTSKESKHEALIKQLLNETIR